MASSAETIWKNCLSFIKEQISDQSFTTWFKPILPKKFENNVLTIQVPSQFFYEWLEEHYVTLLCKAIFKEIGPEGKLEYAIVIDQGSKQKSPLIINLPTQRNYSTPSHTSADNHQINNNPFVLNKGYDFDQITYLNPNYTFSNFIEGDCNQLAKSAAQAVAQKPEHNPFNPLMLYGRVGLGKTHIVQALGNEVKANFEKKIVLYVSSERFTNQFIESLRKNSVQDFTHFYLQSDVLIIDDIQFLAKKEKTQESFFQIFNHLHQNGKQVVMTSDCPPKDLQGLQERLLSRFKWGLTADLQTPDFETRVAIIQNKIRADGIDIPTDLIEYIAQSVETNIRELEGVLISMMAHASLNKREIDLALVKQVLKNIVHDTDTEVSIDYLHKVVTEYFNISLESIKSKTRKKEIVIARHVAMYLTKQYTNHSLKYIGDYCGGRDHSTVLHAIQAVNDMLATEQNFKLSLEEIIRKVKFKMASG